MDRFVVRGQPLVAQKPVDGLPTPARLENPVDAAEVGKLVGRVAVGLVIEHRVEFVVGEGHLHEVPVAKLDQVADSPAFRLLRRQRDVRFAVGEADRVDTMLLGEPDRGPADAAAGIEHPPSRPEIASLGQSVVGPQQGFLSEVVSGPQSP